MSLDGLWDFVFAGEGSLADSFPSAHERIAVPACFDALPEWAGKRGLAFYRREICVEPGHEALLEFEAVGFWARVVVDGRPLYEHAGGYSPFAVRVPASDRKERELIVQVDNRFDSERVPMHAPEFDFYQWGGVYRSTWLHTLPADGRWIVALEVTPIDPAKGRVEVVVRLAGYSSERVDLELSVDGRCGGSTKVAIDTEGRGAFELEISDARLWSPTQPFLHTLRAVLPNGDDYEIRFGLRRIRTEGQRIILNDELLILRGVNRHEAHPQFGAMQPLPLLVADLQMARNLGANFIRGSHYPQDQRFLDLCDEFGFLVWEETLGWGQQEGVLGCSKFASWQTEALEAMVARSFNHPSVVFWGFLNEAASNRPSVRPLIENCVRQLKARDSSRLVTFATMHATEELNYDLVDVVSLNLYPGWYGCQGVDDPLALIPAKLAECAAAIDRMGAEGKPVIVSEIGAEGLYGWHDSLNGFFTEDYQAAYLQRACESVFSHPRYSGLAIWHFADARTYTGGYSLMRPRAFNNKGMLDEYRRPKLAWRAVETLFRKHAAECANSTPPLALQS